MTYTLKAVAALNGAGVTATSGGRKGGEDEGGDNSNRGEHDVEGREWCKDDRVVRLRVEVRMRRLLLLSCPRL